MKNQKMKKGTKLMILFIVIGVLAVMVGLFVARVTYLSAATKGETIPVYSAPKSALLVIDMQKDTLAVPQYKKTTEKLDKINEAITQAKAEQMPVIYIKQEYDNGFDAILAGGMYQKDSDGAELAEGLTVASEHVFSKYRADAFSSSEFEQFLIDNQIDTLYVTGADASACVWKTARGGVNRNYKVIVLEDCLFSVTEKGIGLILEKYRKENIIVGNSADMKKDDKK